MREELARVTLTRKLATVTLRPWKKGERFDPTQLTEQARYRRIPQAVVWGRSLASGSRIREAGARGSLEQVVRPAAQSAEALA
jgi:hypothetical protein